MANIPTDEQIKAELHSAMQNDPKLKCCANCVHYNLVNGFCDQLNKNFPKIMYGCKLFITAEEKLIAKARERLIEQARECEKIEFLLAMSLTSAGMTSLFIEDFERRVKVVYKEETDKQTRSHLRKDLDLADQMRKAMKNIDGFLVKIEQQYRFYIQSHLDKIFKKEGVPYNVEAHDQFLSDSGVFASFMLELSRVAHHNKDNMDDIYDFMKKLKNYNASGADNRFCLDDKDIEHYRIKE